MNKTIITILFLLVLTAGIKNAQPVISNVYAGFGAGTISSNSPQLGSISVKVGLESAPVFGNDFRIGVSYLWARKPEFFFPDRREGINYPYIWSVSVYGLIYQELSETFRLEEFGGVVLIKDRIFTDSHETAFGITFGMNLVIDINSNSTNNLIFGLSFENGATYSNTSPGYAQLSFFLRKHF